MGLIDTERELNAEFAALEQEVEEEVVPAKELLKEAEEEVEEKEKEDEEEESPDAEEDVDEDEDDDDLEEEEPEEELKGAKFRHKLKAEREEKESLQRELNEMKIAHARQQGREEAAPKQEEAAEEIPDQEYEPEKYAIHQNKVLTQKVEQMEASQARQNSERQWEQLERDHSKSNPNYEDAKSFLLDNETRRQKAVHPLASDAQIAQIVRQEELKLVASAAQAGIMPTEQMEFLAYKGGFRPNEKKDPKKKANLKNIKRNAKKNASLIGASGAAESGDSRSAEKLLAMSATAILDYGEKKWEKDAMKALERQEE